MYAITVQPGVITRYALTRNGEHLFSSTDLAQVEAMRVASESAGDDDFTRGYIECIYFTDTGEEDQPPVDAKMSPAALERCIKECASFTRNNAATLRQAYATGYARDQAGRDFWFTRNGHGVGFWDRGLGDIGRALSDAARDCGERYAYSDDNGFMGVE